MTPSRLGWTSLAVAAGASAYVLVAVLGKADDNSSRTEQLRQRIEATPPASARQLAELGDRVDALPSEMPTPRVVVTAVPGAPGPAGPSGPQGTRGTPGTTTVRTVTVVPRAPRQAAVRPRPAPTVTVTERPPCIAYVAGLCVSR